MNKQEHIYRSPKEIALSEMIQASTEELDPLKLFPLAIKELGNVMIEGSAKYPPNNWKKNPSITVIDHVIHATQHLKELSLNVEWWVSIT